MLLKTSFHLCLKITFLKLAKLIMKLGHHKEFLRLRQSEGLASDERLTLEVLALKLFMEAELPCQFS